MKVFQDIRELKEEVRNFIEIKGINIVSIDGKDGSGKSFLANLLSENSEFVHLNLDDDRYLIKQKSTYVDFIKYDNLKNDIDDYLNKNKKIIVDSICILKILNNIDINSGLIIYVKKLTQNGYWFEGDNFNYKRDVEDILNECEEELKSFIEIEAKIENKEPVKYKHRESIFHEIIRYHHEYKPDENADFIFERVENAS